MKTEGKKFIFFDKQICVLLALIVVLDVAMIMGSIRKSRAIRFEADVKR
jgi:hypothetical protein